MSTDDGEGSGCPKDVLRGKWVPRELTFDQKQRNKLVFLDQYVKMDKIWLHHFTLKSNRQLSQWTAHDEPAPKRGKTQQLAGKVMASIFWDAHGIISIDCLEKGRTINSDYYITLLDCLKDEIGEKWPHLEK
ncbi:hypothetical protein GWI33_013741 [Rhynchophorus ferrugineus]|uniref:Transposase n=1 Tax=Rhynchophorus ferrugineus TaxID=354439 RepID=A0A834IPH1_RHYFE|nr:hypothetical protein GWI33_013741 [Rhynchophorus ferrugineus]